MQQPLQEALADIPPDRNTPLDGFVAESLLKKGAISEEELRDAIDECKSASKPVTLFGTLHSMGRVQESDVEFLLDTHEEQLESAGVDVADTDFAFGTLALQKKHTTKSDLWEAIQEQELRRAAGEEKRLGEILIHRGTLTISQAKDILVTQGKRILLCPDCGEKYNVKNFSPDKEYSCLSCGGVLSDTGEVLDIDVSGTAFEKTIQAQQEPEVKDKFIGAEIGGCRIISKIGEGGMGAVYKAHHIRLNKVVALKVMAAGLLGLGDEVHRKRFLREARAAAQLEHPNIVTVYDVNEFENSPYIVMQYVEGRSVGDDLDNQGKYGEIEALRIVRQAAEALDAAQQHNIVHRDIKPDNIMLTSTGQAKVMDFGLAKDTGASDARVTASGTILGTPIYMSPEQFKAEVLDGRSDIYSLGVTLYHMVAGRPPFIGETPFELGSKHMEMPPPSPRNYTPELSPQVCGIVERMLAKNREDRYKSATELVTDIDKALAELTTKSSTDYEPERKRSPVIVIAAVAALVLVAVLAAFLLAGKDQPAKQNDIKDQPVSQEDSLENRAGEVLKDIKSKVATHVAAREYAKALQLLNGFPGEFAGTAAWSEVEAEKGQLMQQVIEYFDSTLKEIDESIKNQNLTAAAQRSADLTNQANLLRAQFEDLPKEGRVAELAAQAQEKATVAEARDREISDYSRAKQLYDKGDLKGAEALLASVDSENLYLRNEFDKLKQDIEKKKSEEGVRLERERWSVAKKEAESRLVAEKYSEAERIVKEGGFERSFLPEVKEEASKILTVVEERLASLAKARVALDLQDAERLAGEWELDSAGEILEKHRNHEDFQDKISTLESILGNRNKYVEDEGKAKELIASGSGAAAREKMQRWLNSQDEGIKKRAAETDLAAVAILEPDMVYFPTGDYKLGNTTSVKLSAFYLDRHEVTNAEYGKFLEAAKHVVPQGWSTKLDPNAPVTGVSYKDAAAYAKWAGKRLPNEEEWEVAASWDPKSKRNLTYPWGGEFDDKKTNIGSTGPTPVGLRKGDLSPCGIHDMAGNVCEWTATQIGANRVVRGGCWMDSGADFAKCSARAFLDPAKRSSRLGFRCAKDAEK